MPTTPLKPHQEAAVTWMVGRHRRGGGCLFDDMGLGKSLMVLAAFEGSPAKRLLIVCPVSVAIAWEKEIAKHAIPARTCVYHGTGRKMDDAADIVITTYGVFASDHDRIPGTFDMLVLDEAHNIVNPRTKKFRGLERWIDRHGATTTRWIVTATPILNGLDDMYAYFRLLGVFRTAGQWRATYGGPFRDDADRRESIRAVQRILHRLAYRRMNTGADLPPKHAQDIVLRPQLPPGTAPTPQTCSGVTDWSAYAAVPGLYGAKIAYVCTGIRPGRNVIVCSQWIRVIDECQAAVRRAHPDRAVLRLSGDMTKADRDAAITTFQATGGILLVSLRAGCEGITLTRADDIFVLEGWWNDEVIRQMIARAYRYTRTTPLHVYRLSYGYEAMERHIRALSASKSTMAETLLATPANAVNPPFQDTTRPRMPDTEYVQVARRARNSFSGMTA